MDDAEFLQRLFEGYVLTMRRRLHSRQAQAVDDTQRELDHFGQLGEALGYWTGREVRRPDNHPMDLSWWSTIYKREWTKECYTDRHSCILHLEHETEQRMNQMTIDILLRPGETKYPVGILANVFHKDLAGLRAKIGTAVLDQTALFVVWVNRLDRGDVYSGEFDECQGWVYCPGVQTFRVAWVKKDDAGFWYGFFDDQSSWQ